MWLIKDSGGIICVFFTYSLIIGISSTVVKVSIIPLTSESILNEIFCLTSYYSIIVLTIFSHLKCMLTDPGSIPSLLIPNLPLCSKCACPKPNKVHHCSVCDFCILKMDHHCP